MRPTQLTKMLKTPLPKSVKIDGVEFVPKIEPEKSKEIEKLEYIFIVDDSGSAPLDYFYKILLKSLRTLCSYSSDRAFQGMRTEGNLFNIFSFNHQRPFFAKSNILNHSSIESSREAIKIFLQYWKGGPSELSSALKKVHEFEKTEGVERIVIIITDGFVVAE